MHPDDPATTPEDRIRKAAANAQGDAQPILIENTQHGYDYHVEQTDEDVED